MFGNRLQEVLDIRDMTQKELAITLGVGTATVNRWVQNVYEPDLNTLIKLSKLFDVSIDYLIGCDDDVYNFKKKRKEFLETMLREYGYLNETERISDEEVEKMLRFVMTHKDYIRDACRKK